MQGTSPRTWKQIDAQLLHARQHNPRQSWEGLTQQINHTFSANLKPEQLVIRYERISTKLPDEDVQMLLEVFKQNGFSFNLAAEQANW